MEFNMGSMSKRPTNLNLFTISFPITAIVSIIHRITGILLFLYIPIALWMLSESLRSQVSYMALMERLSTTCWQLVVFMGLGSFIYHLLAGLRHIVMDIGFAESQSEGRATAIWFIIIYLACLIGIGAWIW